MPPPPGLRFSLPVAQRSSSGAFVLLFVRCLSPADEVLLEGRCSVWLGSRSTRGPGPGPAPAQALEQHSLLDG